jgi:hypothetical protein
VEPTGPHFVYWSGRSPGAAFGGITRPGICQLKIDANKMRQLCKANQGRGGFTYTHHDPIENAAIISECNQSGFTINLSSNSLAQADQYADLNIGPVVTLLSVGSGKVSYTPNGRKVVRCPAETSDRVTCSTCRLCQKIQRPIIGFSFNQ